MRQFCKQLRQSVAQTKVFAVRSSVLPDQRNFPGAGSGQILRLAHHRLKTPAAEFAAKLRNNAEGAGMIAALSDFDVGGVPRRGHNARRQIVIKKSGRLRRQHTQIALDSFDDALDFTGSHHRIHFRHLLENLLAKAFHQAAGNNQFLRRAEFLVLRHLQNGVHRFLLRRLNKAARVYHQHFRLIRARRQLIPFARKNAHHHLAIHEVLRASQADKSDLSHKQ